ncbi:MAG: DUF4268 domain-containing protein [Timaviella obliquedivisa GSE-PSE-MK23-08B]|jgi:hypothetical protein|nr:DUF4268 domain-containing protein [Timaviella obliquedivisa GSE-PSE-MK23-08B]
MTSKPSQKIPLGRLEKVDLRTCWNEEDAEFTLWLAQAENIQLLGDAIDRELEVVPHSPVDLLTTDILCQDSASDRWVLIKSQLEITDVMTHLGKLLADMASLEAATVIWIAGTFTPEHQASLHWLNQITLPGFHFLGLEIELWRIGELVAPKFSLVTQPTQSRLSPEGSEQVEGALEALLEEIPEKLVEKLTEEQEQNLEFWSSLCQQLERRGSIVKPSDPSTESDMSFAIGRAGFRLHACIDKEAHCLSVGLLLSGEDAKPHLCLLEEEQEAIETEIGVPLEWNDPRNDKTSVDKNRYVYCVLAEVNFDDRDRWSDYYQWICLYLEQFHEVFADRVKHLNANNYHPLPDYSFNPLKPSAILPSSSSRQPNA